MASEGEVLNEEQKVKWDEYCQAEKDRIRKVLMFELEQFISLLLQSESEEYEHWVFELSAKVVDRDSDFPIRMPLFERIIFPVLWEGCEKGVLGCARWLSGFSQLIYKSKSIQNVLGSDFTAIYFLKLAIKQDPSDTIAKQKLVPALAWQLDYSVHEVPSGVLWGNDGASIEQCALLRVELLEFRALALEVGESGKYQELINECTLHFTEYPKYLAVMEKYGSYENYLSTK